MEVFAGTVVFVSCSNRRLFYKCYSIVKDRCGKHKKKVKEHHHEENYMQYVCVYIFLYIYTHEYI